MANRSGGTAFFPADTTTLTSEVYQKILDELRRRYVIGYESTIPGGTAGGAPVEIRPARPRHPIRSRGGYYRRLSNTSSHASASAGHTRVTRR